MLKPHRTHIKESWFLIHSQCAHFQEQKLRIAILDRTQPHILCIQHGYNTAAMYAEAEIVSLNRASLMNAHPIRHSHSDGNTATQTVDTYSPVSLLFTGSLIDGQAAEYEEHDCSDNVDCPLIYDRC